MSLRGVLSDLRGFFLSRPTIPTLIEYSTDGEREDYSQRILQRVGVSVAGYDVLNIHRIGIRAPVKFVHEELMRWDGTSSYWPNHIATVESIDGSREHIQIVVLGQLTHFLRHWRRDSAAELGTLFKMTALNFQHVPKPSDVDNARFFLYECSGGYPIGVFCMYVRSPVTEQEEEDQTQLFFAVSFNFYGREHWPRMLWIGRVWEWTHNRVTGNVLNKFKRDCEADFRGITDGSGITVPRFGRVESIE
jgi:hypothetical protein